MGQVRHTSDTAIRPRTGRADGGASAAFRRLLLVGSLLACCVLAPWQAAVAGVPVTLYRSFVGNMDYTATGGSLRAASNSVNPCALVANGRSSAVLGGIPAGATVTAAYLYWAGSGAAPDYNVTLDGMQVSADRTFTETFRTGGTDYDYFSGFEDVTAHVAAKGNGTYTFAGLRVDNGAPYCNVSAVMAGWSLLVVYEHASEPLRAVNVYDGFQYFRGGTLSLTAGNFVIPATGIDGKHGVLTWEGDVENSSAMGGYTEALTFNGTALTDGLNPPSNQFNSTINVLGSNTSYGVDLDNYDISSLLVPGATSATSVYSSGADLVLLSMEVLSVTHALAADLAISKTHAGDFAVGQPGVYNLAVSNNGPADEPGPVTVHDTLPAGLGFAAATGTGWNCTASGQDVSCVHPGPLAGGASLPGITLTVDVGAAAVPAVTNTATVTGTRYDNQPGNNSASDSADVLQPDLSDSTKTVIDVNGGDVELGDILRYTITLIERNGTAVSGVRVTDPLPAHTTNLTVVSWPNGAGNDSTATLLDIAGITLPPGATDSIVFEVTVSGGASAGDSIANTASVANPAGPGASPAAPTLTVSASQLAASGDKALYLQQTTLSRRLPGALGSIRISKGDTASWTLDPALATALTIDGSSGVIPVTLVLDETGPGQARDYVITLSSSALGPLATLALANVDLNPAVTATYNLVLTSPGDRVLPAGSSLTLTVENRTTGNGNRAIRVEPNGSSVSLPSKTVINVDSVQLHDAAYPGGAALTNLQPGATVYIRAVVSDPFGSFDITSAVLDLADPAGALLLAAVPMTQVADSGAATKVYEYAYTLPAAAGGGTWSARVTAHEGSEGTIAHQRTATFTVTAGVAELTLVKSVQTLSDPLHGTFDPYNIPGARLLYTIQVSNSGAGGTDTDTVVVSDLIPPGTALLVGDLGVPGSGPVLFLDGSPASGLGYTYSALASPTDDLEFSVDGADWSYVPTADAGGVDAGVRYIRIRPRGGMAGNSGGGDPSFQLRFLVEIR
ncbi:MAG: hypothetical protein R3F42_05130 [Pseudomonadota bacterium]